MSSKKVYKGTHIEHTTLLSSIDALGLDNTTQDQPLTDFLLLTLSQFIEAIVLHDKLFYETGPSPDWDPYIEIIDGSGIKKSLPNGLLSKHENPIDNDNLEFEAVLWACDQVKTIDLNSLRLAVEARSSSTRGVAKSKGIVDSANPFIQKYIRLVESSGDESKIAKLNKAKNILNQNCINDLGIHILVRIYLLLEWTNMMDSISYLPHLSRAPLLGSVLSEPLNPVKYRMWSMNELGRQRERLIKELYEPKEYTDLSLKPIPVNESNSVNLLRY